MEDIVGKTRDSTLLETTEGGLTLVFAQSMLWFYPIPEDAVGDKDGDGGEKARPQQHPGGHPAPLLSRLLIQALAYLGAF